MPKAVFYWKPTCTTCRNARTFLEEQKIDVEERDINRNPPDRAFLEKHIDAGHFLDFVSKRSPVFKERPLPKTKKEAIDLMMQQSNLIKRPILIRGLRVTFGFDKEAVPEAVSVIRIGTSGWNYPSGKGTWKGIFYPTAAERRGTRRGKFDELSFYAEHFDTVEINSTFYRVPTIDATRGWADRTPRGFEFSLKLFQKFTHPEMFHKSTGGDPWNLGRKDVDEFRAALDPLAEAGKLGALLAQFPASFKNEPDSRGYMEWLLEQFKDYRVAVELRHRSWSDDPTETFALLEAANAAWTQIDEPKFRFSIRQNFAPNTRAFYYLRLHGRNAAQWWKHENSEDRYNYLYAADELEPFAEAATVASRQVKKAYLYANNHFSAKSVANAAILKHQLEQPLPGEYPEEFVERYPDLKGIVKTIPTLIPARKPS